VYHLRTHARTHTKCDLLTGRPLPLCAIQTNNKFSESEIVLIKQQFASIDKDRDGFIVEEEFVYTLRSLNLNPDEYDCQGFFSKADKNKDGKITFNEFLDAYHELGLTGTQSVTGEPSQKSKKEMDAIFKAFDLDGNGYISEQELAKVLAKQGDAPSKEQIKQMMKAADLNG
jgi:Ca2+-binding EF-hand superfamily protein